MNRLRSAMLAFSLLLLCGPWRATVRAEEPVTTSGVSLRALQQERVDTLRLASEMAIEQYRAGVLEFEIVNATQRELLEAQLEMAETREERIKLLTAQLEIATSAWKYAEARVESGTATRLAMVQAKAAMLRVKIHLAKAQQEAAGKPAKPEGAPVRS